MKFHLHLHLLCLPGIRGRWLLLHRPSSTSLPFYAFLHLYLHPSMPSRDLWMISSNSSFIYIFTLLSSSLNLLKKLTFTFCDGSEKGDTPVVSVRINTHIFFFSHLSLPYFLSSNCSTTSFISWCALLCVLACVFLCSCCEYSSCILRMCFLVFLLRYVFLLHFSSSFLQSYPPHQRYVL